MDQEKFWKIRSQRYNNLEWVNEDSYIKRFISVAKFNKNDVVLDVGTGTGVIAHAISHLVEEVIGLDISQDMMEYSNWKDNEYFIKRDIREPIFHQGVFDKITARMVLHHIIDDTQKAMDECYRVLKKGGRLILSEGVPPSPEVKEDFEKIFKIKEERKVFLEEDLVGLMRNSGFKNIKVTPYIMHNFSIKNWLNNSGLPSNKKNKIIEMHIKSSKLFKNVYNLKIVNGDCLVDTRNLIVTGEK